MTNHALAGKVFQELDCPLHLCAKHITRLAIDERMRVTVSTDFVTGSRYFANDLGMALGHITQHEERRARPSLAENVQHPLSGFINAVLVVFPFRVRYLETLIPVLKVYSERVCDRFHQIVCAQSMNSRCQSSSISSVHSWGE